MQRPVFVTRERQLEQLDGFLERALAGQGQVCFVTGEAGSGKTALAAEFARRAQEQHGDLVVAVGQSDAQTGSGDAYLPFREVLSQLTGDVEAELARGAITQENAGRLRKLLVLSGEALVEVGPDLVGIFVPGAGLATRVAAFAAEKVGWLEKLERLAGRQREEEGAASTGIDQSHIFEQYTNVLKSLAEKQLLLLVLDDLQWADGASVDLLFRLGRRIGESRILILGTYRPDEVALGRGGERHPLEKVLAEFKRYFGDVRIDLAQAQEAEGQHFVDAFVDTEPNRLGKGFRQALYHHTGGHPLFTIELLRDMQERGDLVRDEGGRWVEGPVLDWEALPARVEGVIEERVGRLERELREALTVASVEGEDFTAEVVAGVQAADARGLIRRLSGELEKQHRLVNAQGIQRLRGQRLSLYRFQHNLFQTYLYNGLDEVERAVLHEDVGNVLEGLYGDQADDIAVQLARHFVEAGIAEKASVYLRRAGELAAARYANDEALNYFDQALELTEGDQLEERYDLLLARERVYSLQGAREAQEQDLAVLEKLAGILDDGQKRAEVALRRTLYAIDTGSFPSAIAAAQTAIRQAQTAAYAKGEAVGLRLWGVVLFYQGQYNDAQAKFETALVRARNGGFHRVEAQTLRNLGSVHAGQGLYDKAKVYLKEGLDLCSRIGDRRGEGHARVNLGVVCFNQDDYAAAEEHFQEGLHICKQTGDRPAESSTLSNLGVLYSAQGDYAQARVVYEQALHINRETGNLRLECLVLGNLGDVCLQFGDYARARMLLESSLGIARQIDDRVGESLVLGKLGRLVHNLEQDETAQDYLQEALRIAQETDALRAQGISLAGLGDSMAGLGHWSGAIDAYEQALEIWREIGYGDRAMEAVAGLAHVSLAQGEISKAQDRVEEILHELATGTLGRADDPLHVHLTCYRVLRASDDPRAQEVLTEAHVLLQERAVRISDEEMRRSFLENVPSNREIVREFARTQ